MPLAARLVMLKNDYRTKMPLFGSSGHLAWPKISSILRWFCCYRQFNTPSDWVREPEKVIDLSCKTSAESQHTHCTAHHFKDGRMMLLPQAKISLEYSKTSQRAIPKALLTSWMADVNNTRSPCIPHASIAFSFTILVSSPAVAWVKLAWDSDDSPRLAYIKCSSRSRR